MEETEPVTESEMEETEAPTEPNKEETEKQSESQTETEQSETETKKETESETESESETEKEEERKPQFYIGHVAMYMGDGKIIHAKGGGVGVTIEDISVMNAVYACRIILS